MVTAAARLVALSGAGGTSAASRLRRIGLAGATAGALLVAYSGLPSGTAAEHLLHDRESIAVEATFQPGGPDAAGRARFRNFTDDEMFDIAVALITTGVLDG